MIIVPIRSAEDLLREAEWLAQQPRWVQRAYAGFYGTLFVGACGVTVWAVYLVLTGP